MFIYENTDWPNFQWNNNKIIPFLSNVRLLQGKVLGRIQSLGIDLKNEALIKTLTLDVIKTSEIEGEIFNASEVRSSVARRLGLKNLISVTPSKKVDGTVEMVMDAVKNFNSELRKEKLFEWNKMLFPDGFSGSYKILTGKFRDDSTGPMQVVSGALGKEKIHFQAPPARSLPGEMKVFLKWLNQDDEMVIKAAVAHLWFVTLHPFEDGNGRIARAISDMLLAKSDGTSDRFYSMSLQIRKQRKEYYEILEKTQKGSLDITEWLIWFLLCLKNSLISTECTLSDIIKKHHFWNKNAREILNPRQVLMINKLFDGIEGKLTSSKWAKMTKSSQDTALRDIKDLLQKEILVQESGGGRSTSYCLA